MPRLACTIALALAVESCGPSSPPPANGPVEVGVLTAITGDLATFGADLNDSVNLAFSEINTAGGLLGGRQLATVLEDDGTTPEGAKAGYSALLDRQVPVIIGPTTSAQVLAISDQIGTGNTLTVAADTTSPSLSTLKNGGNFFRVVPSDAIQGLVLAQLIAQSGRTNLCIVRRGDTYGMALAETVTTQLSKLAPSVRVTLAPYDPAQADLTGVMDACEPVRKQSNAAVLFITFVADGAVVIDDAASRGWNPTDDKVFLCDGNRDPGLLQLVQHLSFIEGATGTVSSGPDPSSADGTAFHDFLARFRARFGREPGPYAEYAYDATYIAAIAIETAGTTTDHHGIVEAMSSFVSSGASGAVTVAPNDWKTVLSAVAAKKPIEFKGTTGLKHFDPSTGDLLAPYYMGEWTITNGAFATVRVFTCDPASNPPCQ